MNRKTFGIALFLGFLAGMLIQDSSAGWLRDRIAARREARWASGGCGASTSVDSSGQWVTSCSGGACSTTWVPTVAQAQPKPCLCGCYKNGCNCTECPVHPVPMLKTEEANATPTVPAGSILVSLEDIRALRAQVASLAADVASLKAARKGE